MQLSKFLSPQRILLNLNVSSQEELFEKLLNALVDSDFLEREQLSGKEVSDAIRKREDQASTTVGQGLAIPHARLEKLRTMHIALATLETPLECETPDGQPLYFVCMMLAPEKTPTVTLKVMGALAEFVDDEENRKQLLACKSPEEAYDLLCGKKLSIDIPVRARHIMTKPTVEIFTETPLQEITKRMYEYRKEAVPVLNENKRIVGEITCSELFKYGLPDFFSQLKTVSFIRDFDPFERYFQRESNAVARDVLTTDYACMPQDSTLLEVVFELAVNGRSKVYLTDENEAWVGEIDSITVLDNVINI